MATPVSVSNAGETDASRAAVRARRIAYIDPQSYHGLAKYDVGYLRGLCDAGFKGEVIFYCSTLFDGQAPDRVDVRPIFAYNRKGSAVLKALSYMRSMARLVLEAASSPAEIYHFQWFKLPVLDYLCVLALKRMARTKVIMTAHNVAPHGSENRSHPALGRIYRAVDAIVVHNGRTAREITERFGVDPARISVLRHGPIKIDARGRPRHRRCIKRFAAQCDLRFLFIGRGSRYKGLDILLEAWPRFVRTAPGKPGLIVIGAVDDELKGLAEATDREHESLLLIDEYVTDADLYHAIRKTDVAVLPHRRISQSGALLTVLNRRMPVLVSNLPGLVEPFQFAEVGWRFDGSVEGLVDALMRVAERPERVAEIRADERAWNAIMEAYAWRRIGSHASDVYKTVVGRPV